MLPRMVEEFSDWGMPQYWDDERRASREVKQRIVPEVKEKVPWDMFILFGPEATWIDAEQHVLGWGRTVIKTADELAALLSDLPGGHGDGDADAGDAVQRW